MQQKVWNGSKRRWMIGVDQHLHILTQDGVLFGDLRKLASEEGQDIYVHARLTNHCFAALVVLDKINDIAY